MTGEASLLGLLIEDDEETLTQMIEYLHVGLPDVSIRWDTSGDFQEALDKIGSYRYDIIVTDVYDTPSGKTQTDEDDQARNIIAVIREQRMCPIIAYSTRRKPSSFVEGPFLRFVDKSAHGDPLIQALKEVLATGIPMLARQLHDELDCLTGPSYLWSFVEQNWQRLEDDGFTSPGLLERLIRRRASLQLGRIDSSGTSIGEIGSITAADYYIKPPISGSFRLGHILRKKEDQAVFVVLTPHCYLEIQKDDSDPRADHVLLVRAFPFEEVIKTVYTRNTEGGEAVFKSPWGGKKVAKLPDKIRRHIKSPPDLGSPAGRYWFLPRFLDIPNSYCDFLRVHSVPYGTLVSEYDPLGVLDAPFGEAFQACFAAFYASVGLPNLDTDYFTHLAAKKEDTDGQRT